MNSVHISDRTSRVAPLSGAGLGTKLALTLALPLLLALTGFFRHGEWRALRAVLPGRMI